MNILFYTSPILELNNPSFRQGCWERYLLPIYKAIKDNYECRILITENILNQLIVKKALSSNDKVIKIPLLIGMNSNKILEQEQNKAINDDSLQLRKIFEENIPQDFTPDVIVSWETPTFILENLFPTAKTIHLMPSLMARPPYPNMISVDTKGLYGNSALVDIDKNEEADTALLNNTQKIKELYKNYYSQYTLTDLLQKYNIQTRFKKNILVPMQIFDHFGVGLLSNYESNLSFLIDVLENTDPDTGVILTQYITSHTAERVLDEEKHKILSQRYPNLIYSSDFDKIDNISQYFLPHVDMVVTISSTLGLQCFIHDKLLVSPSSSHLAVLANSNQVGDIKNLLSEKYQYKNKDVILSKILFNYSIPYDIITDKQKLCLLLETAYNQKLGKCNLIEPNEVLNYIEAKSNFKLSTSKISLPIDISDTDSILADFNEKIKDKHYVSFDLFDTLVERPVYHPQDVFVIVENKLKLIEKLSNHPAVVALQRIRPEAERTLREKFDKNPTLFESEELTLSDIYDYIDSMFPDLEKISSYAIEIETATELALIKQRKLGKRLFDFAASQNKKIVIASDFSNNLSFIKDVLAKTGYLDRVHKIYVSSEVKKKKHTGKMFPLILDDLAISHKDIVHIGDNEHGDFAKAKENNINAILLPTFKKKTLEFLQSFNLETEAIISSLGGRTFVSLLGQRYFDEPNIDFGTTKKIVSYQNNLTLERLGYQTLGPMLLSFSKWLISRCKSLGIRDIVLFARDCYLPYKYLVELCAKENLLNVHYLEVSRQSIASLQIQNPIDVMNLRSDHNKQRTVLDYYTMAIGMPSDFFHLEAFNKMEVDLNAKATNYKNTYLLNKLYYYLCENWTSFKEQQKQKKQYFDSFFSNLDNQASSPIGLVDFGYKGTIHQAFIKSFDKQFVPFFYMTHADNLGNDPLDDCQVYSYQNLNPKHKNSELLLSYNLEIETLLNQAVGTTVDYDYDTEKAIKEPAPKESMEIINKLHNGSLLFLEDWVNNINSYLPNLTIETNTATCFVTQLLDKPTYSQARLLRGLVFDNSYAGHSPRYLLARTDEEANYIDDEKSLSTSIWQAGVFALRFAENYLTTRKRLVLEGYPITFCQEKPLTLKSYNTTITYFGFTKPNSITLDGVRHHGTWAIDAATCIDLSQSTNRNLDDKKLYNYRIMFLKERPLETYRFSLFQHHRQIEFTLEEDNGNNKIAYMNFIGEKGIPLMILNPDFRLPANQNNNNRLFWFCFGIDVVESCLDN
jgi:predicted HAD superfamily hydrolase